MVTTAQRCPKLYEYQYLLKLKSGKPESAAMHFGTALHSAIESILQQDLDPMLVFTTYWDTLKGKELSYGRNNWEEYNNLAEIYINRFTKLHAPKLKSFCGEVRLKGPIHTAKGESVNIEGTPDFIGEYDGIPCVLDFKTSTKPYDKLKVLTHPQLYVYTYLAKHFSGYEKPISHLGYIVFVSHPEPRIQTIFEEIDVERYYNMIYTFASWAKQLKNSTEFVRNNTGCVSPYQCEFLDKCWTGKDARLPKES
jgi:hypothetical protein